MQQHYNAPEGADILCNDDLINEYGLVVPLNMVRLNRIMLLCRIVRKSPPGLIDMIVSTSRIAGSWAHTVHSDMKWCCVCPKFEDCSEFDFTDWIEHIKNCSPRSRVPRQFRMYLKSSFANISVAWESDKIVAPVTLHLQCDKCVMKFSSEQSYALHQYKAHGIKNQMRRFIAGTFCPVCLRQFWTRERVVNHVRYRSFVCKANLLILGPCLSVEEADALDVFENGANLSLQRKGRRRHHAELPVVRLQGPLRTVFALPGCHSEHHALGRGHNY